MNERYIQQPKEVKVKPVKENKNKKEEKRELPKAGSYTVADLEQSKKIYSNTGGKY